MRERDVPACGSLDPQRLGACKPGRVGAVTTTASLLAERHRCLETPNRAALGRELFPRHRIPHWCWDRSHPLWIPRAASERAPPRGGRVWDGGGHLPPGRGG